MAAIAHAEILDTTGGTHTGDANWTTVVTLTSGNFVGSAKYLILGLAQYKGSIASTRFGVRLADGATPTAIVGSSHVVEHQGSTTDYNGYSFMGVYTAPSTPVAMVMQVQTIDTGETVSWDTANIIAIRLDDDLTENTDWHYNEDNDEGAPTALTTTPVTFATITFTPGTAGDDWLVIGHSAFDVNNVALNAVTLINYDAGTSLVPMFNVEGENTADTYGGTLHRVYNLTAASHTFALQMEDDGGPGNDHSSSRIFAINLSKFEQNLAASFSEAEVAQTTDAWTEVATATVTPDTVDGDWLFIGSASADAGGSGRKHNLRIQNAGVTFPVGSDGVTRLRSAAMDSTDEPPLFVAGLEALSSGSHLMDLDGSTASSSGGPIEDISFSGFSMELAASGFTATGAITRPFVTVTGTGAIPFTGTGAVTRPFVTVSGTGTLTFSGSGAITRPFVTVTGTGALTFSGSGAITRPFVTTTGTGTLTFSGSGAITRSFVTVTGTGALTFTATGAITRPFVTVTGTGTLAGGDVTIHANLHASHNNADMGSKILWTSVTTGYIGFYDATAGSPVVYKTTDSGGSWVEVDAAGQIAGAFQSMAWYWEAQNGNPFDADILHVTWLDSTDDELQHATFDIGTETWSSLEVVLAMVGVGTNKDLSKVGMAVNTGGDVLIVAREEESSPVPTARLWDESASSWSTVGGYTSNEPWWGQFNNDPVRVEVANGGADFMVMMMDRLATGAYRARGYRTAAAAWSAAASVAAVDVSSLNWQLFAITFDWTNDESLLVFETERGAATNDLKAYTITWDGSASAPTMTAEADLVTDDALTGAVTITYDPINDDMHVAYTDDAQLTPNSLYKRSSAAGGTYSWSAASAALNTSTRDIRAIHGSVITTAGGRVAFAFQDDDGADLFYPTTDTEVVGAVTATGAITRPFVTVTGTGTLTFSGSGAITRPFVTVAGTGALTFSGSGAITRPFVTTTGTGTLTFSGSGAITRPFVTVTGTGTVAVSGFTATGAITRPFVTVAGTGTLTFTATGAITRPFVTVTGTGTLTFSGSGAITRPFVTVAGTGTLTFSGSGAITRPFITVTGTGTVPLTFAATGSITRPFVTVIGIGHVSGIYEAGPDASDGVYTSGPDASGDVYTAGPDAAEEDYQYDSRGVMT